MNTVASVRKVFRVDARAFAIRINRFFVALKFLNPITRPTIAAFPDPVTPSRIDHFDDAWQMRLPPARPQRDADQPGSSGGADRILHACPAAPGPCGDGVDRQAAVATAAHLVNDDGERGLLSDGEAAGDGRRRESGCSDTPTALDRLGADRRALRATWRAEDARAACRACRRPVGRSCGCCGAV